ncbi:MAG: helicase SNF2 [Sulfobacillus acidophilus]|uniref:Helicase SNF2 n=1 Tax=Sulfobacillus acidophilus TaxID=53633 RepID=A0A2T2WHF1_9FIRM|nr:MAG: helicase SNF2 [Sulfobacillus acidophilus]
MSTRIAVSRRDWPVYHNQQWGFLIGQDEHFVPRDQAVAWTLAHADGAYRHVFFWWDFFLEFLLDAELLPAIDRVEGGWVPHWRVVGAAALVADRWADEALGDSDLHYLTNFLDDWVDAFVRQHAPDLDARRAIGGPLGRRLVARLMRPRGIWDVNANDQRLLAQAIQDWERSAQEHPHRTSVDAPIVRIIDIRSGLVKVQVVASARELAEWSLRFPMWQRVRPSGDAVVLTLSLPESEEFWRDELPALKALGAKIELPANWRNPSLRIRGRVDDLDGRHQHTLGLDQIVQVDWQVLLGDQLMSLQELEELVRASAPLLRLRDQFVVIDDEMLREARRVYERAKKNRVKVADALRWTVGGAGEGIELITSGDLYEMLAELTGPYPPFSGLKNFRGALRPYQQEGVQWMVRRMRAGVGALLADDMGLGKTVEVIAALTQLQEYGELDGTVLIAAPLSVVGNWEREFERFNPSIRVGSHLGTNRLQGDALIQWTRAQQAVLTTYDVLLRDIEWLRQIPWIGVVADEAQQLKNPGTKRARAMRRIAARWRVALTGTPVENRLGDLWAEMEFLNPGYLGSSRDFRQRFERGEAGALDDLKRLLTPFVLRRMKTDPTVMPDLPEKVEIHEWTLLTPEQIALYQAVVDALFQEVSGTMTRMARRGAIVAALTHLKQVTDHPALYLHEAGPLKGRSGKLERLEELLSEILQAHERVVVFTQYVSWVLMVAPYLKRRFHVPVATFHGALTKLERDQILTEFSARGGPPILLASLKAGGVGLNLASAQHVIHFDRWWNPATEDQATDRVWRMGQTELVTVHKFVTRGTVEERIDALIREKRRLSEQLLTEERGDAWVAELSNRELRELVELRETLWID